jgi:hypothetical protein
MKHSYQLFTLFVILSLLDCHSQSFTYENPYSFDAEIRKKVEEDTVSWKYQLSAASFASKGAYTKALEEWSKAFGAANRSFSVSQADSIRNNFQLIPAKEAILQQAGSNKILIINEAHHKSSHRVFTESLLKELYELGYTNLGVEALSNGEHLDAALNKRKYPVQATGYYIKDPSFGNLIRTALKLSYTLFPYEQTGRLNGKEREIAQAKNIQNYIEQKPDEKFLIYCGFDHSLEGRHSKWGKAMAERLKEFTGKDPLTINQVKYSERSDHQYDPPLLKALEPDQPVVLLNKNSGEYFAYEKGSGYSDIAILHPRTQYVYARPEWMFGNGRKPVKLEKEMSIDYPIMVLAYQKGENIKTAVPVDIIEVETKEEKAFLALKKGSYNIVVTNQAKESSKYELKVE